MSESGHSSESAPRNYPKDHEFHMAAREESKRFFLKHGEAVFSTVALDVEMAIDHAADEFPDEDADEFEAIECPECGSEGRSRYSFTREIWSCEECDHHWDGVTL